MHDLWAESTNWRSACVLLQYTTMAWSRRGFPFGAWIVLALLRRRGLHCAVVFHEATRQTGDRWVDRFRGACQDWVIRRLYSGASAAIFLDPLDKITWLPHNASKAVFIPIGANIPESQPGQIRRREHDGSVQTVAVFCLSDSPNRHRELEDIAHAMRIVAQLGVKARIVFLGRGTEKAREDIERLFDSSTGEAVNLGLQTADEVRRVLSESDAMLCVRGPLYMRRGSAIAGIACGLPIVGYAGAAEGTPLEQAGVQLVPDLDREALGKALARVLMDDAVWFELQERSIAAQRRHFSWDFIAAKMAAALQAAEKRAPA
jgi:glycosyltransferase involved in cell wall biosynthesis